MALVINTTCDVMRIHLLTSFSQPSIKSVGHNKKKNRCVLCIEDCSIKLEPIKSDYLLRS